MQAEKKRRLFSEKQEIRSSGSGEGEGEMAPKPVGKGWGVR